MDVVIAGGHGQIALRLSQLLSARGDRVRGLIRDMEGQGDDVRAAGAEPVFCDLEHDDADAIAELLDGADALVFAAGAGPGSGAARKGTMDRDGAVKTVYAAGTARVPRYVMVSAMGADAAPDDDAVFSHYLRAKKAADEAVRASDLRWTIVRPGGLTDEPGTGRVLAGPPGLAPGRIPRDDVAAVIAGLLGPHELPGVTFDLVGGEVPIAEALATLAHAA